jgi:hypothetical protein
MSTKSFPLWEMYVPVTNNAGGKIRPHLHQQWRARVRDIAGGLTLLQPVRGEWSSPNNPFEAPCIERVTIVRIACSENNIQTIAVFTAQHYRQKEVMYTLVGRAYFYSKDPQE